MNTKWFKGSALAGLAMAAAFAAAENVQVTVNGNPVTFDMAQPQMVNGRVLVPLRGVFEQLGANVEWNEGPQSVIAVGSGKTVRIRIGAADANVNGRIVTMDVPPELIDGSTMVPLRFLSESLGARVDWRPENNLVAITTHRRDEGAAQHFAPPTEIIPPRQETPPPVIIERPPVVIERPAPPPVVIERPAPPAPLVVSRDTVIPLSLDEKLTSNGNQAGDRFTASVRGDGGRYLDFPDGTVVEGYVKAATAASGSHAGTLNLRFTHIRFPDGNRYPIAGVVTMLNDHNIVRTDGGRFVARNGSDGEIARDAEIGAGAGLIIGSTNGKAVGGAVVGGSIGAIVGAFDHRLARNVIFNGGTRLGLILNRDLRVDRRDIR